MTRFVIVAPGSSQTGGPEALHQLADALNQLPQTSASLFYTGGRCVPLTECYWRKYRHLDETHEWDLPHVNLVLSEGEDPRKWQLHYGGRKFIWWLAAERRFPLEAYQDCFHLFQSYYAMNTLASVGLRGLMLTDYLDETFLAPPPATRKKDIVAVNGTKGLVAAVRLGMLNPDLKLVIIRRLTPSQVRSVFDEAKIYLDLGWHPGRDRQPREAALRGCVVLVSAQGTASDPRDMPFPDAYKLPADMDPLEIASRLRQCLREYPQRMEHFQSYRDWILRQPAMFQAESLMLAQAAAGPAGPPPSVSLDPLELAAGLDAAYLQARASLDQFRRAGREFSSDVADTVLTGSNKARMLGAINRAVLYFRLAAARRSHSSRANSERFSRSGPTSPGALTQMK